MGRRCATRVTGQRCPAFFLATALRVTVAVEVLDAPLGFLATIVDLARSECDRASKVRAFFDRCSVIVLLVPPVTVNEPDASVSTDFFALAATGPSVFSVTVPEQLLALE